MASTLQDLPSYPVDRPLRLSLAARIAFPDGSITASGLRREAQRGRLVIERIAGKDYTTLAAIDEMRKLCRVENLRHTSGSSPPIADVIGIYLTDKANSTARPKETGQRCKRLAEWWGDKTLADVNGTSCRSYA